MLRHFLCPASRTWWAERSLQLMYVQSRLRYSCYIATSCYIKLMLFLLDMIIEQVNIAIILKCWYAAQLYSELAAIVCESFNSFFPCLLLLILSFLPPPPPLPFPLPSILFPHPHCSLFFPLLSLLPLFPLLLPVFMVVLKN